MGVIIDKCANNEIFATLNKLNIPYCKSTDLDFLYTPVNTHPDMQIHFVDSNCAIAAPSAYEHYKKALPDNIDILKGTSDPDCTYPGDCAYNVAKMGRRIIGNLNYLDTKIMDYYLSHNYEFINVNQGYTKCNLCVIDENSAITEDEGLYRILSGYNINVLKIPVGTVSLSGFDNGFIGGASGFISKNTLAFCGKINNSLVYNNILNFVNSKNIDIIFLSSTNLQDYGSILYFDSGF